MFATTPAKIAAMVARLQDIAADLGLDFGPRTMTYNSRVAQELSLYAEHLGRAEAFHAAAFAAYFVHGQNLAKNEVLLNLAQQAGLPGEETSQVIIARTYSAALDRKWAESRRQMVTAVPTLICGSSRLVGFQDASFLVELLEQNGITRRT